MTRFDPASTLIRLVPDADEETRRALHTQYGDDVPAWEIQRLYTTHLHNALERGRATRAESIDLHRAKFAMRARRRKAMKP